MAMNSQAADSARDDAADRGIPAAQLTRYKWMASILVPSRMRGMYVKPLEKITGDPKVPFVRLVIAMLVGGVSLVGVIRLITDDPARAGFIAWPLIFMLIAVVVMLVCFILSSRGKSMLTTVIELNLFKALEARRARKNLHITTLGIKEIDDDGRITFDDGDVGCAYSVRGQLSPSTLPVVADMVSGMRAQYLVTRTHGSQEIRITSVEPNTLLSQRKALYNAEQRLGASASEQNRWRAGMCLMQRRYMNQLVKNHQLTIQQTVILRDTDMDELARLTRQFESFAHGQIYERCALIDDREELELRLAGVTMGSTAGKGDDIGTR